MANPVFGDLSDLDVLNVDELLWEDEVTSEPTILGETLDFDSLFVDRMIWEVGVAGSEPPPPTLTIIVSDNTTYSDTIVPWVDTLNISISQSVTVQETATNRFDKYRYWRIYINATVGGHGSMAEVQLRESIGGSDVTGSGTASASSTYAGEGAAPANCVDNDSATWWASSLPGNAVGGWWAYDFGVDNEKSIVEVVITSRITYYTQAPSDFTLQYSNDNSTWYDFGRWGYTWTSTTTVAFSSHIQLLSQLLAQVEVEIVGSQRSSQLLVQVEYEIPYYVNVTDSIHQTDVTESLLPILALDITDTLIIIEHIGKYIEKVYWCWGEETPDSDESAIPWSQFRYSDGRSIGGDYDALSDITETCYSPVFQVEAGNKQFTIYPNKYEIGDTPIVYIRGSISSFLWDDETPSWTEMSPTASGDWTYIQLKITAIS